MCISVYIKCVLLLSVSIHMEAIWLYLLATVTSQFIEKFYPVSGSNQSERKLC